MTDDQGKKTCKKCGIERPLTDFYKADGCVDGRRGECRFCFQARLKARSDANPDLREAARRRTQQWVRDHPERKQANNEAYRGTEAQRASARKSHLKHTFGLSPSDYDALLADQGGGCAICGRTSSGTSPLHVDHDHATGRVRGILCFNCNVAIGSFHDSVDRLRAAIAYLERHATAR